MKRLRWSFGCNTAVPNALAALAILASPAGAQNAPATAAPGGTVTGTLVAQNAAPTTGSVSFASSPRRSAERVMSARFQPLCVMKKPGTVCCSE